MMNNDLSSVTQSANPLSQLAAVGGVATPVPGQSLAPGLGASLPGFALPGLDIVANIKTTINKAAERAGKAAAKAGSAWGSRNVPSVRKYELPDKLKPKVKEETKKKAKEPSKLATIKKEEEHKKEKNPSIPSHVVVKKPPAPIQDDQENNQTNNKPKRPASANKPSNVSVHRGNGSKGSINMFDPLSAVKANKGVKDLKK